MSQTLVLSEEKKTETSPKIDYSHLPGAVSGPFHVVKQRWLNIAITLLLLVPGLVAMIYLTLTSPDHLPLKPGIDFTGGVMVEYSPQKTITQDQLPKIRAAFEDAGLSGTVVQLKTPASNGHDAIQQVLSVRTKPTNDKTLKAVQTQLESTQTGTLTLLQKTAIGPSMAGELITKGLLALALAYVLIVAYLTIRFQLDFAICAMISLVHDALFVVGAFAVLGVLFGTEIDSLFITGILTVVGFSVHDTIVVYDRIRENLRRTASQRLPFWVVTNMSVNQTLRRSINTSLTALLPLLALLFFGGSTTRDFVLCMALGILVGTYSSIAVASMLVCWWREHSDATP